MFYSLKTHLYCPLTFHCCVLVLHLKNAVIDFQIFVSGDDIIFLSMYMLA